MVWPYDHDLSGFTQIQFVNFKVHGPIFQNLFFSLSFEESSLQKYKFQISVETVQPFGCTKQFCRLQLPISYCASLNMITIIRHIFIRDAPITSAGSDSAPINA